MVTQLKAIKLMLLIDLLEGGQLKAAADPPRMKRVNEMKKCDDR